ncbi:helix-turn-helix transcriptional regulator (plasmid) [Streptomyces sp. NBC_01298]|uniref:helix-turn-helix domain-containing protein n=1 Tax=Streptomyces sp. NBC_01298 TaxID=2903817 RepID=UPI002E0E087A|nr:helix-turn-helix transcriptional regulator [Streptomyces sp. NBC_01298]
MSDAEVPWSLPHREVGSRLEELRERHGLTQSAVVDLLGARGIRTNVSSLSKLENGKLKRIPSGLIEALLDLYETEPESETRRYVLGLLSVDTTPAGRRRRPPLWRRHAALLGPMKFEPYLQLERKAAKLRNHQPRLVPGLLQTCGYAQRTIETMRPELSAADVRGLVDVRMDRQRQVLGGDVLHEFQALLDEEVLRRQVGDEAVRRDQLRHLLVLTEQGKVTIRVLPDSLGIHPGMAGPFVLMGFDDADQDVVWCELAKRSVYFDQTEDVDYYDGVFTDLWERALCPAETRALIKKMI